MSARRSRPTPPPTPLAVGVLGPLEVRREGETAALPRSRKTRGLLGYLVVSGGAPPRARLCDLLFADVADPRSNLRWSLSHLRPLLAGSGARLETSGDGVGFVAGDAEVDLLALREAVDAGELARAVGLFRGELLDGLEVPRCPAFDAWLAAERERLRRTRQTLLDALVRRLADRPAEALPYAFTRLSLDPLDEVAHAAVVRLLVGMGRAAEARERHRRARRLLADELGEVALPELDAAARELGASADAGAAPPLVARLAHAVEQAGRGGDDLLAARAAAAAGRQHLRRSAWADAARFAARGLAHAASLPSPEGLRPRLDVLELYLHPALAGARPAGIEALLRDAAAEAARAGWPHLARDAWYLLALLAYQRGRTDEAAAATRSAERAARDADPLTAVRALADTARCLGLLERDMGRAAALAHEAAELAAEIDVEPLELPLAFATVDRFAGDLDAAARRLARAVAVARRERDPWWQAPCLELQAVVELERGRAAAALDRCRELRALATVTPGGSEGPFADALAALARGAPEPPRDVELDAALERLRRVDARWKLAWALATAAERDLAAGRPAAARWRGEEAAEAADVVGRDSLGALARAVLARADAADGNPAGGVARLAPLAPLVARPRRLSARARRALGVAAAELVAAGADPADVPTPAPTPAA